MYSDKLVISNLRQRLAVNMYSKYPGCTEENADNAFNQATERVKLKYPGGITLEDLEEYLSREVNTFFLKTSAKQIDQYKKDLSKKLSNKYSQCTDKEVEEAFYLAKETVLVRLKENETIKSLKNYLYSVMSYELLRVTENNKKRTGVETDYCNVYASDEEYVDIYSKIDNQGSTEDIKIFIMERLIETLPAGSDKRKIIEYSKEGKTPREIAELIGCNARKVSQIKCAIIKKFNKVVIGKNRSEILNLLK